MAKFKCEKCGKTFDTQNGLSRHSGWCGLSKENRATATKRLGGRRKKTGRGKSGAGKLRRGKSQGAERFVFAATTGPHFSGGDLVLSRDVNTKDLLDLQVIIHDIISRRLVER